MSLQLSQGIGYNTILLPQHASQPTPRCVAIQHKVLVGGQYRHTGQYFLNFMECFLTSLCPLILSDLPSQVSERGGNLWEVLNKPTTVPHQAQETSHLCRILRSSPLRYCLYFWGSIDTPSLDTTCPKNATLLNQNSYFVNLAHNSFFLSTSRTILKWCV